MLCQMAGTMCQRADYKKGRYYVAGPSCEDKRRNPADEIEKYESFGFSIPASCRRQKKEIYLRQKPGIVTFNAFQNKININICIYLNIKIAFKNI